MEHVASREIRFDYIIRSKTGELLHCPYTLNQIQDSTKLTDIELEGRIVAKRMFTGLKDKNKKEAYEHDIYKDRFGTVSVIVFHRGAFRLKHPIDDAYALADTLNTGEVIGNIHQNPELLEPQRRGNKDE